MASTFAAAALYTAMNHALNEVTDDDERRFQTALAAYVESGFDANLGLFGYTLAGMRFSRQELGLLIDAYRLGEMPLLAPLTLLKHHLRRYPDEYVLQQSYLEPHPSHAALRRQL